MTTREILIRIRLLVVAFLFMFSSSYAQVSSNPDDIKPLLKGENIPGAAITSLDGKSIQITDIIKKQKTVLFFYTGGWCPYCNTHLSAIGALHENIQNLGV